MTSLRILDAITNPHDISCLTNEELEILAQEIRNEIIETTSQTGGHIGSSLGAVEIILALHSLIESPRDHLVFDVGHQAYAHKLLCDRRDSFHTLRSLGGISGFTKPEESAHDKHASGHASDSLSIALGLAKARDIQKTHEHVVAIIGDAAISGGMAFEALNQIGQDQTRMLIVLNDNEMSISPNVGALVKHLGMLRATNEYRSLRDTWQQKLESKGKWGRGLVDLGRNAKDSLKQFIIPQTMIFEELGITCTAPIDGHNIALLREVFASVLDTQGPVLVHCVTKKGKGYAPAENEPEKFHGVGSFTIHDGSFPAKKSSKTYTQVFSESLIHEARKDSRIVAITAAMPTGTGIDAFAKEFPDRAFDVGIAEGHGTAFASGMAQGGLKPVCAIYSTFEQRALDQLIIDNALISSPVVFALDRAGLVGDDGSTHHGVFDIAYMRMIPNMTVFTPSNEVELIKALRTALKLDAPSSIRYPRGAACNLKYTLEASPYDTWRAMEIKPGHEVAILAFGRLLDSALKAADMLEEKGVSVRVVDMRFAKPLDMRAISKAVECRLVVTLEEGVIKGGVGQEIASLMPYTPCLTLGIPDNFVEHGKVEELFSLIGLDARGICQKVEGFLQKLN